MDLLELVLHMLHDELDCHAVLASSRDDDVGILHGRLNELMEGLQEEQAAAVTMATGGSVELTGFTNLLYCLSTPCRSQPLSDMSLFSLSRRGRGEE